MNGGMRQLSQIKVSTTKPDNLDVCLSKHHALDRLTEVSEARSYPLCEKRYHKNVGFPSAHLSVVN